MNQVEAISLLRNEAANNPVARDVFHMFAQRERTRHQVTVEALSQRMKAEGFMHSDDQYRGVLKLLGGLGFGKVETNAKGRVIALKDVKTTLQSIGAAALKQEKKLESFTQANRYQALVATAELLKKAPTGQTKSGLPVSITVVINEKAVNFRVPKELNANEIADLVLRFRD